MEVTVTLLATPLVVLALVNLAKRFGLTGAGPLSGLAVLLGVALALADYAFMADGGTTPRGWYVAAAAGLVLGLTAAGLYDAAALIGGGKADRVPERAVVDEAGAPVLSDVEEATLIEARVAELGGRPVTP